MNQIHKPTKPKPLTFDQCPGVPKYVCAERGAIRRTFRCQKEATAQGFARVLSGPCPVVRS